MFIFPQAPGPGTYNTTEPQIYRDKAPQYSMTSRNVMPGDTTQKPGPGAHSPEIVSYGPTLAQIHLISTFGIVWGLLLVKCLVKILQLYIMLKLIRITSYCSANTSFHMIVLLYNHTLS